MTCIIGLVHEGKVYMGGDSMAASGWDRSITALRKVFHVGEFLVGYTSSFRMGQILEYHLNVRSPEEGESELRYMVVAFAEAVRACLKSNGYSTVQNNEEKGGTFLVGYRGKLYCVANDFQVNPYAYNLGACGCGESYALGAMLALQETLVDPEARILRALKITETFSSGVVGPFYVEVL